MTLENLSKKLNNTYSFYNNDMEIIDNYSHLFTINKDGKLFVNKSTVCLQNFRTTRRIYNNNETIVLPVLNYLNEWLEILSLFGVNYNIVEPNKTIKSIFDEYKNGYLTDVGLPKDTDFIFINYHLEYNNVLAQYLSMVLLRMRYSKTFIHIVDELIHFYKQHRDNITDEIIEKMWIMLGYGHSKLHNISTADNNENILLSNRRYYWGLIQGTAVIIPLTIFKKIFKTNNSYNRYDKINDLMRSFVFYTSNLCNSFENYKDLYYESVKNTLDVEDIEKYCLLSTDYNYSRSKILTNLSKDFSISFVKDIIFLGYKPIKIEGNKIKLTCKNKYGIKTKSTVTYKL